MDLLTSNYSKPKFPTIQGSPTDEIEAVLKVLVALKVTKRKIFKQIARRSKEHFFKSKLPEMNLWTIHGPIMMKELFLANLNAFRLFALTAKNIKTKKTKAHCFYIFN